VPLPRILLEKKGPTPSNIDPSDDLTDKLFMAYFMSFPALISFAFASVPVSLPLRSYFSKLLIIKPHPQEHYLL